MIAVAAAASHPSNLRPSQHQKPNPGKPTTTTTSLSSLLQRCSTLQQLHQIQARILKTGPPPRDSDDSAAHTLWLLTSLPSPAPILWNTLLSFFSLHSHPELCLLLLKQMLEEEDHWRLVNPHTFPPVLKACVELGVFLQGAQVHGLAIKPGVVADTYVHNSLIQMYFGFGMPQEARLVFDRMPNRSVVSWNCIVAGFADLGQWDTVKSLFWLMVEEFPSLPSSVVLVRMLTACSRSWDFDMGKRVHQYISESGVVFSLNVGNALMNMYAKFGDMEEAKSLFRRMPDRDVVSWTTLVSGYAGQGHLQAARELFEMMPDRNVVAWNAMIAGYAVNDRFVEALLLFREMLVLGVKPDKASYVNVLSACTRLGDLMIGRVVHGYIYKVSIDMTLDLIHSILGMYVKSGSIYSAVCLFKRMAFRNEISWTLMMEAYVKNGEKEAALEIFNQMPHKDLASWNSLISALAQCNFYTEVFGIFQEMQQANVRPNALTLVSMLSACAKTGSLAVGKWIHAYIDRIYMVLDIQLGCALIDMYAKCGCLEESLDIFNRVKNKDLQTWSTMIGGLAMHGRAEHALSLFKQMLHNGFQPDGIAFLGILSGCCHAGLVEEGCQLFNLMTKIYGISPTAEHCSCMVDLFGRQGLLIEAVDFINNLSPFLVGETVWKALLAACTKHGNVTLAEYTTKKLLEINPRNSGAYVLLSNTYAKASKWHDVGQVRNVMRLNKVKKVPGCSSIEVDDIVHEFFVGDASHPLHKEIYMVLDVLEKQMTDTSELCSV